MSEPTGGLSGIHYTSVFGLAQNGRIFLFHSAEPSCNTCFPAGRVHLGRQHRRQQARRGDHPARRDRFLPLAAGRPGADALHARPGAAQPPLHPRQPRQVRGPRPARHGRLPEPGLLRGGADQRHQHGHHPVADASDVAGPGQQHPGPPAERRGAARRAGVAGRRGAGDLPGPSRRFAGAWSEPRRRDDDRRHPGLCGVQRAAEEMEPEAAGHATALPRCWWRSSPCCRCTCCRRAPA